MWKNGKITDQDIKDLIKKYANDMKKFYKYEDIPLTERDIDSIFWFHEEHLTDSHQLHDTVELVMRILGHHKNE